MRYETYNFDSDWDPDEQEAYESSHDTELAYCLGYEAFLEDIATSINSNPYAPGSPAFEKWERGFFDAEEDFKTSKN